MPVSQRDHLGGRCLRFVVSGRRPLRRDAAAPRRAAARDRRQGASFAPHATAPTALPVLEKVPIIHGQHAFYILTELRDYRAGRRANDTMAPIAKDLSDDDMKALATYFAGCPGRTTTKRRATPTSASPRRSRSRGSARSAISAACSATSRNPRLNHQKIDYLQQTMTDLRDNVRLNAAAMAAIVRGWSDDDIGAMSRYLAGL